MVNSFPSRYNTYWDYFFLFFLLKYAYLKHHSKILIERSHLT
nr:MAG TPA: hypothetical protein [Caudoviricetes sp.]